MIILEDILSQEIVQRLGWTLLHFIWQAAAVALILTILLRILRKSTANVRYIFACLALALIVLLPIITIQLVPVSQPLMAAQLEPASVTTMLPAAEMQATETIVIAGPSRPESVNVVPAIPFKQRAVDTLEPALPYIVSGWLIGVFGLSIWHLGGWAQLHRLKRRMVKQVDSTLLNKLKVLTQKLKIKQTVRLMESAIVQIPTVVGWLRPVILLPASALSGLNTEQLEAIIAHELAHIKRFDYLINILQTVVETLGFYHPAVWWVSHKIRAERENCCDDMAVGISGDRVSYAGALASMEEIRAGQRKLAVAATGGNLFRRICRLLGKDSTDNTGLSWVPAATAILLIIALAIPTTLALTNKSDSLLTKPQAKLQVEDDIQIPSTDSQETADTQIEAKKILSAHKLKILGLAVAMYADDHDENLPESIQELKPYIQDEQDFDWILDNVEYFDKGKSAQRNAHFIPIAYDSKLPEKADGTNVLFLDFSVRFVDTKEFEKLDFKRAEILIKTWILEVNEDFIQNINHNADSPDEAKELLKLKSKLLAAKTQCSILDDHNVDLLLKAVRAHKDSKVLASPQVLCLEDKTAEIRVMNREYYYLKGYTEPNDPAEKPQPIPERVEEGVSLSLRPNLTPNNNIDMQFELEIINVSGFEEKTYKGKYPYKLPSRQSIDQATRYIAKDGQTMLFGGHKIVKHKDGRTEQKNLLILIKAHTASSSKQEKPAQAKRPAAVEPTSSTTQVITPPATAQSRRVKPDDRELKKTKAATLFTMPNESVEPNEPMVTVNFNNVEMKFIIEKLAEWTGKIIIPTADSMSQKITTYGPEKVPRSKAVEMIYSALRLIGYIPEETDNTIFLKPVSYVKGSEVPKISEDYPLSMVENKDQVVQKFFKLKHHNSSQMAQIILPLVGEYGHVSADERTNSLLVIDTVKSLIRIEKIIAAFDVSIAEQTVQKSFKLKYRNPSQMAQILMPLLTKTGHVSADESTRILLVIDTPENLNRIEKIIAAFDVIQADKTVQKFFKLKYYSPSQMGQILGPLLTETGYISADENTGNLLVIDTVENLKRIELIITEYDVPRAVETVTEIFEIRNGDPVEIVELLKKLINGRPENGAIIEQGKEPIVLIPEPRRKWIIAKASAENIKQIGEWIQKLDTDKTTMGLDPIDKAVHEQLEMIVDLPGLTPGMSFGNVIERLKNSVDPPLQIQPIWKDLLENAEVEQATPAGMDPLTGIKLRKALEILLAGVSSAELPKLTYIVEDGAIVIGTAGMLPQKLRIEKLDTPKSTIGLDPIDAAVQEQLETIIDLSNLGPGTSFGEVIEMLKVSVDPPLQIQPIWRDLLENAEVEQATPASMDPLPGIKIRKALEILLASITTSQLGESAKPTYIVDDGVIVIGTAGMLPQKMWIEKLDTPKSTIGLDPIDEAVQEQLETIIDLSNLSPGTSFGEVIEMLKVSVDPPLQIQPIWRDLLENAEVEQATPAGMDPLPGIKIRKALEILLASVTTSQLGESAKPTYIVDDGVIVIGTAGMLPQKKVNRVYNISDPLESAADVAQSTRKELEKTTPAIKPYEMQILRQQYINNDLNVKSLSENINKIENELIDVRQKFTPSHPEVQKKSRLLRAYKNALQERKKEVGKSFDDIMTKEIRKTNQEQIATLLDELQGQFLSRAPKVPLISSTFVDETLINALQSIARMGNVTIIPDETVKGLVSCKLKDVTVETALDIVLGGTPYIWKKTPHYYLVASGGVAALEAEPSEITARMESAKKLSSLGKALLIYANDHDDKYPNSLHHLSDFLKIEEYKWVLVNVEYLASGKTPAEPPDTPLAYDKTLLEKGKGTNVLYNDCHVGFVKAQELKKLGISESEIMIETQFWSVNEDFLKDVGLDVNFENISDDWRGHLAATYPTGPNGKPYGLMIDDLHLTFLLRAIQANHDSKAIVAPRVLTREGTTAEMGFLTEEYNYISGYDEPQDPSGEPQPKRDKVDIGTRIWLTPKLTENSRNINMDLKLKITQLEGIIEGKYKEKYPIYKPIIDLISAKMPCTIPVGKSMLIGGLKINEHVTITKSIPGLKDLPLIGAAFRSKKESQDQKMLLILVKPITNPQQKATKVLPGQEDSEEDIRRLAEQLDKKIKSPAN